MLKVLFVFNHPAFYKVRFLNELSKHVDLTVIFERDKNSNRNKLFYSEQNYNFHFCGIKGIKIGNENIISTGVKNHIKNNRYDLIIMNGYSNLSEISALKYLKKHNIEYVLYINGGIIKKKESSLKRKLKTRLISGAKYYLSPDERSNQYLIYYGAKENKIFNYPYSTIYASEIAHNSLSTDEIKKIKNKYGIKEETIFVSSGQLIERKNYLGLVKSWKNVDNNYTLIIIGEGKQKKKIQDFLCKNNIENVYLMGHLPREEMFKLFKISKAFVFPSKEDIYGHVINEALSQGLPIISSPNVNASIHLIENGINGFIVEDFDSKNFLDAINYVLSHKMRQNAINCSKENTIEKMVEQTLKIIEAER